MKKLDEPVCFYLRHQKQIEEWAALGKRVRTEAQDFFTTLVEPLDARAADLDGNPSLYRDLDPASYSTFGLLKPFWQHTGQPKPLVSVCMQWHRSSDFTNSYTGIRVEKELDEEQRLKTEIQRLLEEKKVLGDFNKGNSFPVYKYQEPAQAEYWQDLDGFAEQIIETLCTQWDLFLPIIDQALVNTGMAAGE
jgi:hypothetical protein